MRRQLLILAALLCWLCTLPANADSFIKSASNYRCMVAGNNVLQFTLPTFDWYSVGANVHVTEPSYVEVSVDNSDWKKVIVWKHPDTWRDHDTYMRTNTPGELIVKMTRYGKSDISIKSNDGWKTFVIGADADDDKHYSVTVQWLIPYEWQGKNIKLRFSAHWDDEGSGTVSDNFTDYNSPAPPEVAVNLMEPMVAYDKTHVGEILIPYYIQASKCKQLTLHYADAVTDETHDIPQDAALSGNVYVPMDRPLKDVYLVATIVDANGNELSVQSESITVKNLHTPASFNAVLQDDATVKLSWTVDNSTYNDIMESDYWEIQRNMTGATDSSDPNWKTLMQIPFEDGTEIYEYTDEEILQYYLNENIVYRIRRMSTAVWDWAINSGTKSVSVNNRLSIVSFEGGTVQKSKWTDDEHVVRFTWSPREENHEDLHDKIGWFVDKDGNFYATKDDAQSAGAEPVGILMSAGPQIILTTEWKGSETTIKEITDELRHEHYFLAEKKNWNKQSYTEAFQDLSITGYQLEPPYYKYWSVIFNTMGDTAQGDRYAPADGDSFNIEKTWAFLYSKLGEELDQVPNIYLAGNDSQEFIFDFKDNTIRIPAVQMVRKNTKVEAEKWKLTGGREGREAFGMFVDNTYGEIQVWDNRARLLLYVHMVTDTDTLTDVVDLSSDEGAVKNHTYEYTLPRKCVDYTFDLVLKRGTSPMNIYGENGDSIVVAMQKVETGDDASYWFLNTDSVMNLTATTRQNSVILQWESSGGERDYYKVLRRDRMSESDDWEEIATDITLMSYEDKTVQPQHNYDYRVESVFQCEGMIVNAANITGNCEPTGMVKGYLRLADGTGMGGYTVKAVPKDIDGAETKTAVTDDSGYFEIAGLVYDAINKGFGQYEIMVETGGGSFTVEPQTVTFDATTNIRTNVVFYVDTYYVYSGNVYYEGTSIPVVGASFKMDGVTITDGNGNPFLTDSQGAFELSIPKGVHQVQAVKDGHVFKNDGFLLNPDAKAGKERDWNWTANKAEVYLWDQTEVVLHGRVIGGNRQGEMELGKSFSTNNLGDSIRIVMQLEGDNTSWIVRDQLDPTVTSRTDSIAFGLNNKNLTVVNSTRHTITVEVDNATGEYEMRLKPVKYKVTQIFANGYATLFQQGKVGETLDLSFNVQGDTAVYNRIFHSDPSLDVRQFNGGEEYYFGMKQCLAQDNAGNKDTVTVWNAEDGSYSFGYPVFMGSSPYGWILQACEKYYYNNDYHGKLDIVNLEKGTVTIRNRLVGEDDETTVELDETGGGSYVFTPQNTTFNLDNDQALRAVNITLEYDGTFFDVKPFNGEQIRGYVMAVMPKPQGKIVMATGVPLLFDILRDPPGGGSSAYIEAGSKLSYAYNMSLDVTAGIQIVNQTATKQSYYYGSVVVPSFGAPGVQQGLINGASTKNTFSLDIITKCGFNWTCSYNLDVTERIQTSNARKWVGPKADLFIGTNQNVIMQDAIAVRVVPESQYKILSMQEGGTFYTKNGRQMTVKNGDVKKLAEGQDANGNKVYLVRDEVMGVSTKVVSTFVHSQHYIENELIPTLCKVRNSLLLSKDSVDYAQQLANQDGIPYYVSSVDKDSDLFGLHYQMVVPQGKSSDQFTDSLGSLNQQILYWSKYLAQNEEEKLKVSDDNLVKNYDFDGATSIQYSESFSTGDNYSLYLKWPFVGTGGLSIETIDGIAGKTLELILKKTENQGKPTEYGNINDMDDSDGVMITKVGSPGNEVTLKLRPVLNFQFDDKNSMSESESKKIGFTLALASKSNLNVDVYRTVKNINDIGSSDDPFYKVTEKNIDAIRRGDVTSLLSKDKAPVFSSFVYRTRGGVTSQPYEDERVTKWYNKGAVLDEKTKAIDNPRIWAEQTTVSNVPFDEPARFTIYMTNETDFNDRAASSFNYCLDDKTNPRGAKLYIDGNVLNGAGTYVSLSPVGSVLSKQLELYPNTDFDYENIGVTLYDPEDGSRSQTVYLTAHFVPTAGKVNISMPGDKWVINTEGSYDSRQQKYYMPVRIDGFDVNYRGFDHIELQYKLSTQGDKDWVNVCSYYHDKELMAKASGVCDTIPDNGTIVAAFYGENDPIEQEYDIRAVSYCRHGSGFLTASSDILSGIKDTRRPEVFGTPQPVNGILGIGDDIQITFSEAIAGNYLSKANNFEVLGTPVSNDISLSTALEFAGATTAKTNGDCPLAGKDFTVDVMLNPADNGKQMVVLAHGGDAKGLRLGLSADRKLMAEINNQVLMSDKSVEFAGLHQVAYSFGQGKDGMTVTFFDGNTVIGQGTIKGMYDGSGCIVLGRAVEDDADELEDWNAYEGDMLELRIWNRNMGDGEIGKYSQKVLTGYEHGLLSYYKLNEGKGDYSYDYAAGGNDLFLGSHSWKHPQGISLKIDGKEGVKLVPDQFVRSVHDDFTLMFWFRSDQPDGTLIANGEAQTESGAENHFNIGLRDAHPFFRSNGHEVLLADSVSLTAWHHFVMTVQRARNVADIYIDNRLYASFSADSVGGISGNQLALGATYDTKGKCSGVLTGYIDEVGLFASALPENLFESYATETPLGSERALLAYLDFGRSEKQDDNTQRLEPTGISIKRYFDNQGKEIEVRRDTIIAQRVVEAHADRTVYAPMARSSQLDNIKYSYASDGNKLLINLDVPDAQIEKTNVYVTIHDVADLNGNLMKSPLTMDVFVYRNPLRWSVQHISEKIRYGEGLTFTATVQNLSGKKKYFELKDLPIWISASVTEGVIAALDEEEITFTVSPYINIGNYNELISLVGDNDMSESLTVKLTVRGEEPSWAVSDELRKEGIMMQLIARVEIDKVVADDPEDVLAVFGEDGEAMGVAHIDVDNTANAHKPLAFIIIYGHANSETPLEFRFYDASTGEIYRLEPADGQTYTFDRNAIIGTDQDPVVLCNTYNEMATIDLNEGWNWVSFNVAPMQPVTVGDLLYGAAPWSPEDVMEIVDGKTALKFFCVESENSRGYRWTEENKTVEINPAIMYRIYSTDKKKAYFGGEPCYSMKVKAKKGWSRIAYLSVINLPVAQAMSEYLPYASKGDVLKSQDAFSILSPDGAGNLVWKGTLKYMETGKGYMLKRLGDGEVSFAYPLYYNDSRYREAGYVAPRHNIHATTMNIVAEVAGVETLSGDTLTAYNGAERCGTAVADEEGIFYLNVGVDEDLAQDLTFCIERGGEVVAVTRSKIGYKADNVLGTPEQPTEIDFASVDEFAGDGGWYSLSGIKLNGKPQEQGVYIHNGKAVFVK